MERLDRSPLGVAADEMGKRREPTGRRNLLGGGRSDRPGESLAVVPPPNDGRDRSDEADAEDEDPEHREDEHQA